ncbi:MAG: hypothetical protein IJ091_08970 [Oscillospiraceae bacterium]|nr:hypothetical protein [Oscillospiraceae bacterium]
MIPIFYRNYPYAPLATLFSAFSMLLGAVFAFGGLALVLGRGVGTKIAGVLLIALGALCLYEFFTHKIADKISAKYSKKNIETKAGYALQYCRQHPESYEYLVSVNEQFAKKYVRQEDGKIVRRK